MFPLAVGSTCASSKLESEEYGLSVLTPFPLSYKGLSFKKDSRLQTTIDVSTPQGLYWMTATSFQTKFVTLREVYAAGSR